MVSLQGKRDEWFAQSEKETVRQRFVNRLLPLFISANCACFLLIVGFGWFDFKMSQLYLDHRQIITMEVLIAVITATAAQLGAVVLAMGRSYFK